MEPGGDETPVPGDDGALASRLQQYAAESLPSLPPVPLPEVSMPGEFVPPGGADQNTALILRAILGSSVQNA